MECPHCHYQNGVIWYLHENHHEPQNFNVRGDHGKFYRLQSVVATRRDEAGNVDKSDIMGCPQCKVTFMRGRI